MLPKPATIQSHPTRDRPLQPDGRSAGQIFGGTYPTVYGAAALSLASALVYLWSLPMQSILWWGYSLFFLAIALAQGIYAAVVLRWPTQRVLFAGVWLNLALFVLYIVWFTEGIPFGPHTGMLMDLQRLDIAGALTEAATIVALVTLLRGKLRRTTINALFVVGVAIWVAGLAGFLS